MYKNKIAASKALLFVRPNALSANEAVEFKKQLSAVGAEFNVIKNTLFKIALTEAGMPEISDLADGANAVVFAGEDFVAAAKAIKEFASKLEDKIVSGVGILDSNLLTKVQVTELADMPPREVIISQILGILEQPMSGVVNVLEDSMRSVVYVLDQAFKA